MFLDVLAPMGAAADMRVPPDGEAFLLERGDSKAEGARGPQPCTTQNIGRPDHCCPPATRRRGYVICLDLQNLGFPAARYQQDWVES